VEVNCSLSCLSCEAIYEVGQARWVARAMGSVRRLALTESQLAVPAMGRFRSTSSMWGKSMPLGNSLG